MPTQSEAVGFSNKWYQPAFENSIHYNLGDEKIRIFSPPFFIASKLEAFLQRGKMMVERVPILRILSSY
jgi:hypothetical protein